MGEVIREDARNNFRLFAWPCPHECKPGGTAFIKSTVSIERVQKQAAKQLAKSNKNAKSN